MYIEDGRLVQFIGTMLQRINQNWYNVNKVMEWHVHLPKTPPKITRQWHGPLSFMRICNLLISTTIPLQSSYHALCSHLWNQGHHTNNYASFIYSLKISHGHNFLCCIVVINNGINQMLIVGQSCKLSQCLFDNIRWVCRNHRQLLTTVILLYV